MSDQSNGENKENEEKYLDYPIATLRVMSQGVEVDKFKIEYAIILPLAITLKSLNINTPLNISDNIPCFVRSNKLQNGIKVITWLNQITSEPSYEIRITFFATIKKKYKSRQLIDDISDITPINSNDMSYLMYDDDLHIITLFYKVENNILMNCEYYYSSINHEMYKGELASKIFNRYRSGYNDYCTNTNAQKSDNDDENSIVF